MNRVPIPIPAAEVRPADELAELSKQINADHEAGEAATREGLERFRAAGEKLLRAKKRCGHGRWLQWLAKNVKFSQPTAWRYMRLAKDWEGKSFTTNNLTDALRALSEDARTDDTTENGDMAQPAPEQNGSTAAVWRDRDGKPVILPEQQTAALDSPLKYHGGKSLLAPFIVALMPPHKTYVEAYCGSARVFFARDPNDRRLWLPPEEGVIEILNDLDGRLTNFLRVLQRGDQRERLLQRVEFTNFNEREFRDAAGRLDDPDPVTAAHAYFVRIRQSLSARMDEFASITQERLRRGMVEQAAAWQTAIASISAAAARLATAVILDRPALEVIDQFDDPDTCFYFDPPYPPGTRAAPDVYHCEMTDADHQQLLARLKDLRGKAILSGHPCPMYDQALAGWNRLTREVANHAAGGKQKNRQIEVLWYNF